MSRAAVILILALVSFVVADNICEWNVSNLSVLSGGSVVNNCTIGVNGTTFNYNVKDNNKTESLAVYLLDGNQYAQWLLGFYDCSYVCNNETSSFKGSYDFKDIYGGNVTYFYVIENISNATQSITYTGSFSTGTDWTEILEITLLVILVALAVIAVVALIAFVLLYYFAQPLFYKIFFCIKNKQASYDTI